MKIIKYGFLLATLLISQSNLFAGRGNPIMVIEVDCGEVEQELVNRNGINIREIPTIFCDIETYPDNNGCPPNYIAVGECDCVPDCESIITDCEGCTEIEWIVTDSNEGSDDVGFCGCQPEGFVFCGCPSWLTLVPEGGEFGDDICDIVEKPCFDGDLMVISESVDCGNINNGLIQATVIIDLGMGNEGACVSIVELENCELSAGEDFVIALADQYGASAAFCAEDDETTIELDFFFDPDGPVPSWVWIDVTGMEMTQALLSPENLCPDAIPTLSTWMIIALGLIMTISGLLILKRKEVRKVLGTFMMSF